jgi:PKD repeat protein
MKKSLPARLLSNAPAAPSRRLLQALVLLGTVAAAGTGQPLVAQTCDFSGCGRLKCQLSGTPARPAPVGLWGDLQAVDPSPMPAGRDATAFDEFKEAYSKYPWYTGLDTENGYLFTALSHGIQVWGTQSNPDSPELLGSVVATSRSVPLPVWVDSAEEKWPLRGIDAPPGVDSVVALSGRAGIGISIWDTSTKSAPKLVYQNHKKDSEQVYAATIGGVHYAFMAADGGQPSGGLYAFNMSQALQFNRCVESWPAAGETIQCPGVYVGKIGTRNPVRFVHGVDHYVVASSGSGRGFDIFNVANPAAPLPVMTGLTDRSVYGVAMWKQGSKYYLGLRSEIFDRAQGKLLHHGQIYDVSCISGGTCSLGAPLWQQTMDTGTPNFFVTHSQGGSNNYLYFGSDNRCSGGAQREWLFDVSAPSSPRDLSPAGYWQWYYRGGANGVSGFNNVMPRVGKFSGDHFYRAALSIMDIHKRTGGVAPNVDFTWTPAEVYEGTTVNFQDSSFPLPTSRTWNFADGTPGSATTATPQVTFPTAGQRTISLTAANAVGSGNKSRTLTVLAAAPAVGGVQVVPANPTVCQPITLTATGVTGRPPLSFSWEIRNTGNNAVTPGTGNPYVLTTTPTFPVVNGTYSATVTVGGAGSASKSTTFTVASLGDLPLDGAFTPTKDSFTSGTVQFHVSASGATEWSWDFDDDANANTENFGAWSNDPVTGPNPSHTYTSIGTRSVKVKVRNCVNLGERKSAALSVQITQTTPLHAGFQGSVFCSRGVCFGETGVAIAFTDSSTGAEFWDYDWNGDGDFTDAGDQAGQTSPVLTHTYTVAGEFAPKLRVRRGASEEDTVTHGRIVVSGGGGGPTASISVTGPVSGAVGAALSFTATASNCSASASGWSWSVSGGTISGASSGPSITVAWANPGSKSVQATNSGCGTTTGTRSVTITGGDGGGALAASFTFSPATPAPGQAVTFNGGASTGSPSQYAWDFGDGTSGTGQTATHTYAATGNYLAKLTVTKPGSGPGCVSGHCFADTQRAVPVGDGLLPLDATFAPSAGVDCINVGGFDLCTAPTGAAVTLTATLADATSYSWSFGDNTSGTGRTVTKTWNAPGTFVVSLTVTKGAQTASKSRNFQVNGQPVATVRSVVLPWIAQTRGALRQSSDLYVHNPTAAPMTVKLEFRKRGQPETTPPQATRTIAAGATLFIADVLDDLFNRENLAGFVTVKVEEGSADPVITSFNTIFGDGGQFGQTVPGISMSRTGAAATADGVSAAAGGPSLQHLIGLNDTSDRLSYFGVSNPADTPATYRLRFFDHAGVEIGQSAQFVVPRFGQRQFQRREIEAEFGVSDEADYRVMIETQNANPIFPYAANLRIASEDPSFVGVGTSRHATSYLIGALSTPGLLGSKWESDVVVTNPASTVVETDVTFTRIGFGSAPTTPFHLVLQPGETQRLSNLVGERWNITDSVGVLRFDSQSASGVFPIIQGESYDNSHPAKRFGQSMMAMSDAGAAGLGQGQYLVGLRQGGVYRTTLWLFNPSTSVGQVDLVYRGLDGAILGRQNGVALPAGRSRQLRPTDHSLPAAGVTGGFTVQVLVRSGKVLAAAQVVNNATNDPAYISGETR